MISTNTPEGQPLYCIVCKRQSWVLVSDPPGDSVCPHCGSHGWIGTDRPISKLPSISNSGLLTAFLEKLARSRSSEDLYAVLVDGLAHCLLPISARFISFDPLLGEDEFQVVASRGEIDGFNATASDIIHVLSTGLPMTIPRQRVSVLLVPLTKSRQRIAGVFELKQKANKPEDIQRMQVRIIQNVFTVAATNHVLD